MSRAPLDRLRIALVLVALLAAVVLPASADSGDNLLLGRFNTAQTDRTTVWANSPNWGFRIKNVRAGAAALSLENDGEAPPLRVNSTGVVDNLNADYLDGKHLPQVRPQVAWCGTSGIPAGTDWSCTRTLNVPPGGGTLVVSGSAGVRSNGGSADWFRCWADITGIDLGHSVRNTYVQPGEDGNCAVDAIRELSSGDKTAQSLTNGIPATMEVTNAAFWVMVVPG